jgi:flagellar secretion chaperone FliS
MQLKQSDIAGLYSQGTARGATQLGLVVALYDTIVRDLRRANEAIVQKNIEKRTFEMNHALRVIAELENVLDFENGRKAAKKLKQFYTVTRGMILDAGVHDSAAEVNRLIEIFGTVRQAWQQADEKMNGRAAADTAALQSAARAIASNQPDRVTPAEASEIAQGQWRA